MRGLPVGCLNCCLSVQKVACFLCAISRQYFRQLYEKPRASSVDAGLPRGATVAYGGNPALPTCCLEGCQ